MGQLLSHPLTEKTIEYNEYKNNQASTGIVPRFYNCVGSMQGYRLTQEDAHLIRNENSVVYVRFFNPFIDKYETLSLKVFAVFDGHGGDDCSKFLSGGRHHRDGNGSSNGNGEPNAGLIKWIAYSFENHHYTSTTNNDSSKFKRSFNTLEGLVSQIFKDAFILQDEELYRHFANSSCGSTAVVACIINEESLYVANCGDSRCILSSKSNGIKTMSFDHKPQHIGELIRINDNGGTVSLGRVGGVLALSRAFSDFQFKRGVTYPHRRTKLTNITQNLTYGTPPQEAQVTVEPDVLMHKIDYSKDEFLVLACDGIWDIYNNKQLIHFIKYHLVSGTKLDTIITKLLDHGIAQANSNTGVGFDNMTAIIVVLNRKGETLQDWFNKMKTRLERERGLV
ncbi:CQS_1a_G0003180.mRNA.1.CDS.1 [Saccharomyces cerevisiae]|nr:CQS_1a_G0003180.mRNA.1.CDS.1 [Saccharomyces cerevisiae]CAI7147398.1 CQS_1a_G0003180.mRNA.1.CDS.1 [Saccharomyces cerevisiae]